MTLDFPPRQSFGYLYIHIPPAKQQNTLLFLHGFPSQLHDWTHQIHHFSSLGHGILACDLLGRMKQHLDAFGRKGGYTGATRWYRMWLENRFAPDEVGYEGVEITQQSLFVVPKQPAASAEQQRQMLASWTPSLTTVYVDSGHWVHLERASETNRAIEGFLRELRSQG
ncbi:Uncharacterized protein TPAR_03830 [Tolypocladium paradoxum]|uniref:Epoxide hydrolase n=1 Tax=Tolypocladium paradoxum TaxID=94208 RepID=A0A2S4L0R5_9HYPO|nr:Uncharacterized protein TPAR_03830 [Tolypocladium paradoxum]